MLRQCLSNRQLDGEVRETKNGKGHQTSNGRKPNLPRTKRRLFDEFMQIAISWRRYQRAVSATDFWNEMDVEQRRVIESVDEMMLRGKFGHVRRGRTGVNE